MFADTGKSLPRTTGQDLHGANGGLWPAVVGRFSCIGRLVVLVRLWATPRLGES